MNKYFYEINKAEYEKPLQTQEAFHLHSHDEYEVYMFVEGDARYVVEEKNYSLSPGDVILIRKHEMHRVFHNSDTRYRRFVLWIAPQFFEKHSIGEYEAAFSENKFSVGNKISSEIVRSAGLYDAVMRLKKYSDNYNENYTPIVQSIVIEIVYLINKISSFEATDTVNKPIQNIINYINRHFTSEITLDTLCEKFFVSKYHLCRIFKEATGLTVQEYIREKRLTYVASLKREGKSLTQASIEAGFSDYSSFYRAYVKRYGISPKNAEKLS
ncbi:MAG: helix-turn-helix domain-containing protein [Clostridia bacterium]|nr:helix-turn-helix domain-containing protein [Clostridia bacterium]MBQ6938048.1 helix-turn-helix domain-containing protein [Clostridia bacterium]MBR2884837.1 helix-turn-helix domain-containing protein [Clostridia bacterium]